MTSGIASTLFTAAVILSSTARGVPRGAKKASNWLACTPGKPASALVGMFGATARRLLAVTNKAVTRSAFICGSAVAELTK